ncbi:MAG TPA: DUF6155 family protein [Salinimicrobium sp.]|nr:DUF6155 family protein [Salinimicrobium sp.]
MKAELKKLDKKNLIALIADLYKKNNSVKEFLDFYVNPNQKEAHKKYREKILEAFYPKRGDALKLKDGKKAISDFKKLDPSPELLIDLMLFFVENGVQYTNDFGDINEAFYISMEKNYQKTLSLMEKEDLLKKFKDRAHRIVVESENTGWGFNETLWDIFGRYYPER